MLNIAPLKLIFYDSLNLCRYINTRKTGILELVLIIARGPNPNWVRLLAFNMIKPMPMPDTLANPPSPHSLLNVAIAMNGLPNNCVLNMDVNPVCPNKWVPFNPISLGLHSILKSCSLKSVLTDEQRVLAVTIKWLFLKSSYDTFVVNSLWITPPP